MNLGRIFRTVRHLSASQVANRPVCRGKFVAMELWPGSARAHFSRRGEAIGPLDFTGGDLAKAVGHVVQLQQAVHGRFLDGIAAGRFTLLNREIDFGNLDAVDWRRELGERNNRLWRMNLSYMGYLVAFAEREGAAAVPVVRALLASMTAQNPWSSEGVFRDVWHPYSVSHRVINLIACLTVWARDEVVVESSAWAEIEAEIRLSAAFVLGNLERDLQYNHLFKNLVCLAMVAAAQAGRHDFAAWVLREVAGSIAQQFLDDGGHAERAPMYHLLSVIDLRILRDSAVLAPASAAAVAKATAAAEEVVATVTHPDGDVALFNDSWLGEAPPAISLIGETVQPRPQAFLRLERPEIGYARLAQGGDCVVLDFGACGPDANPGHAHADFLSLELSIDGVRTIVDPGVSTYSEGEARDVSRSAASHNGPCLIGAEPIEFWSSFRVGRRGYAYPLRLGAAGGEAIAGRHDGYGGLGVTVARAVRLIPGRGLLVADLWRGPQRLAEESRFLIAAQWRPTGPGRFERADAAGARLSVVALRGRMLGMEATTHCLRFGEPLPATRIGFAPQVDGDVRLAATWFGSGADAAPEAEGAALAGALKAAITEVGR
ncbi:heparinase II/III family protein [Prosthecomicrobium hirschii]|uniref:heparinase II/III family protein n=1 Tax=Prosthecodimorpha hirschii TaxID=665126 RepID=UPI00221F5B71|nr:heparinase II/III-family protein [Prosthecomicrobium hirschii]MCW1843761.1 heparinase II/III-family protein [Prosthecomicrobium hirschii]